MPAAGSLPEAGQAAELAGILDRFLERATAAQKKTGITKYQRLWRRRMLERFRAQKAWFMEHALPHLKLGEARGLREADQDPDALAAMVTDLLDHWMDDPEIAKELDEATKLALAAGVDYVTLTLSAAEFADAIAALWVRRGTFNVAFGVDNPKAVEYLVEHAFERIADLVDGTTKDLLHDALVEQFEQHASYDEIAKALRDEWDQMSTPRARMIAVTEMGNAYSEGTLAAARDLEEAGIDMEKSWLTVGDDRVDEECSANEEQGWIGLDEPFQSGDDRPLQHPNCRCALLVRRVPTPEPAKV